MGTLVEIVPYDPTWSEAYSDIEAELRSLLDDMVQSIDHVGSTAVPALAAKPYIDIDVVLNHASNMERCRSLLEASGYEPRGSRYDDGIWAFMIRSPLPGRRVYLCPSGSNTHDQRLRFRDMLRSDRTLAHRYSALKEALAKEHKEDGDSYTKAKTDFIKSALNSISDIR